MIKNIVEGRKREKINQTEDKIMALTAERYAELTELCRRFRIDVLTAIHAAQSGHPGGSLSVCEILTYLYQEHMNLDASKPLSLIHI